MFELKASQLGQRMRTIRKSRQITQKKCAGELGVTPRTLLSYEKGDHFPHIKMLWKFTTLYNANLRYLFLGMGEMFDTTPPVIDSPAGAPPATAGKLTVNFS